MTLDEQRAEIKAMTTKKLCKEFNDGLRVSVAHLNRLALVLAELEARGERVEGVAESLLAMLRRIAAGELLAEAVARFADRPEVLRRVGTLPMERQRIALDDESVIPPKKARARHMPDRRTMRSKTDEENPIVAAACATPKDLASMMADMLRNHPTPEQVWSALLAEPFVRRLTDPNRKTA